MINLGVALWVVGSCFKLLLLEFIHVWGTGSYSERLQTAFEDFKAWCSQRGIPLLIYIEIAIVSKWFWPLVLKLTPYPKGPSTQ